MGAVTTPRLGREFDRFLYASVGDDQNGMPLTVLSALARMDVDPWEEASKLTQLPPESAVTQLASLLGALQNTSVAGQGRPGSGRCRCPIAYFTPCRSGISPHAGPTFHVMPVQVFTACRSKISRQAGQDFTENQAGRF